MDKYDIAVIGAGPAGYNCAINFAKQGKKVVIIEKDMNEFILSSLSTISFILSR